MAFELADMIPWGRTFDEYVAMFALGAQECARSILGCADGSASFNFEAQQRNVKVVSADPLYQFTVPQIRKRIADTAPGVAAQIRASSQDPALSHFKSADEVIRARMRAMQLFLADFPAGLEEGRYVPAELPQLPFFDATFDLALCSHLLFQHGELHDVHFHLQALRELCRVAHEVRVFPLLAASGAGSPHLPEVLRTLEAEGFSVTTERVDYGFQTGANQMLRLIGA